MSSKPNSKPITNILAGKSIIGSPVNDDLLVYDVVKDSFVYLQRSTGGSGITSINGDSTPNQIISGEEGIFVISNQNNQRIGLSDVALQKLDQEGATDGQVLKWSDANSKYEPQDP